MKTILLAISCFLLNLQNILAQEPNPDLIRTWYATEVIVDGVSYIPSEYGHFPSIPIYEFEMEYFISLTTPGSVSCEGHLENFSASPDSFSINQDEWICLLLEHCNGDPEGPCAIMFGKHAQIYFSIKSLFNYTITEDNDGNFALEVVNAEGNSATYSNLLLSTESFTKPEILVYPNPVSETLFIETDASNINSVSVFNLNGQKIIQYSDDRSSIDLSSLKNGIYFLSIDTDMGILTKKFIKN